MTVNRTVSRNRFNVLRGTMFVLLAIVVAFSAAGQVSAAEGYYFQATAAGNASRTDVATTGDGAKVLASRWGGTMQASTDSGATWNDIAAPGSRNWRAAAMSKNGQVMVGVPCGTAQLQISTDGGATWNARASARNWVDVQMSDDGSTMIATAIQLCGVNSMLGNTTTWLSQDSGTTWTQLTVPTAVNAVAVSSSGDKLIIGGGSAAYESTNDGATWQQLSLTPTTGAGGWSQIVFSRDGSTIVAIDGFLNNYPVPSAGVYISKDSGATWTLSTTFARTALTGVAVSSDGQFIIVQDTNGAGGDGTKSTVDGGTTWSTIPGITNGAGGWHFAMSDNGLVVYASQSRGGADSIYRADLVLVPTAPRHLVVAPGTNEAQLVWDAPLSNGGSPITDYLVEYSTDNGTTWQPFAHTASTTTSLDVTGLDGGIGHLFRVSAINFAGTGPSITPPVEGMPAGSVYDPVIPGVPNTAAASLLN